MHEDKNCRSFGFTIKSLIILSCACLYKHCFCTVVRATKSVCSAVACKTSHKDSSTEYDLAQGRNPEHVFYVSIHVRCPYPSHAFSIRENEHWVNSMSPSSVPGRPQSVLHLLPGGHRVCLINLNWQVAGCAGFFPRGRSVFVLLPGDHRMCLICNWQVAECAWLVPRGRSVFDLLPGNRSVFDL